MVSVDGDPATLVSATRPRPDLAAVPGSGPRVGFVASVALPGDSDAHRVCVHAVGTGPDAAAGPLGCRSIEATPERAASDAPRPEFDAAVRLGAAALGEERPWVLRRWLA